MIIINILAIGIVYGDTRARINILEKIHAELKSELRNAIKIFGEKQEKALERLISIEAILKTQGVNNNVKNE